MARRPGRYVSRVAKRVHIQMLTKTVELSQWGCPEGGYDQEDNADFRSDPEASNMHNLQTALNALGIDARSNTQGGDNYGYYVEHGVLHSENYDYEEVYDQTYTAEGGQYHVSDDVQILVRLANFRSRKPARTVLSS